MSGFLRPFLDRWRLCALVASAAMLAIAHGFETFGGFLLLIGLFTRPVAFVLSGLMAFAYWIAHAPQNTFPVLNGGEHASLPTERRCRSGVTDGFAPKDL